MEFNYYDYCFKDDYISLITFLEQNKIAYKRKRKFLTFRLKHDECRADDIVKAFFQGNKITKIVISCFPQSFKIRKKIENYFNDNYSLIKNDYNEMLIWYQATNYQISLYVPENIQINVYFVEEEKQKVDLNLKKIIPYTALGVLLSAYAISSYFWGHKNLILSIVNAIIVLLFTGYELYNLYLKEKKIIKEERIALLIVLPLIIMIFIVLITFGLFGYITDLAFLAIFNFMDVIFILIYLLPSFHIFLFLSLFLFYA